MSWLDDVRTSYDTVAEGYAAYVGADLGPHPHVRGALAWTTELLRDVDGPVLDVGCGTGLVTAHLRDLLGPRLLGLDLSPRMIAIARRDHPDLPWLVASMTALPLASASVAGVISFYSLVHTPDEAVDDVFAEVKRVLKPEGVVLLAFHAGDGWNHKTSGYGGRAMNVLVHRRPVRRVAGWLRAAGFTIELAAHVEPDGAAPGGVVVGRRRESEDVRP